MKSKSETAVVENSNTQVEEVAAEHTSSAKGGKFESRRDNMETFIADHCLEQAADAVVAEAHPTAEAEDHVPASCRDIEFDSLESEEVLDKMVVLRKELEAQRSGRPVCINDRQARRSNHRLLQGRHSSVSATQPWTSISLSRNRRRSVVAIATSSGPAQDSLQAKD
jgi:hypothetical protein